MLGVVIDQPVLMDEPFFNSTPLKITYNYKDTSIVATDGSDVLPEQTENCPKVTYVPSASHYTLVLTDPDAPSADNPTFREFVHWVVVNIPGNEVALGETISSYIGAGPPYNGNFNIQNAYYDSIPFVFP